MSVKEDPKSFEVESFLSDLKSNICRRKRRLHELSNSRHLDIFADSRAKLMVKKSHEASNNQPDISRLIEHAIERTSVEGADSPLSPLNTDLLFFNDETSSIYFEWSCTDCPLYLPKICNCGRKNQGNSQSVLCSDENCQGLTKIPYSLIQVPLNRNISSIQTFVSENMGIPNSLIMFYGKLKNSLLIVLFDKDQEKRLVKSLSANSDTIGCIALYEVFPDNNKGRVSKRPYTTKIKFTGFINKVYQ
ncbi:putative serine/threonine-protein kinase nek2 [Cryptosporidium felis]|nr:putative serine/threonine-protein kinase nek2 [Cryptosporidium felis]